MSTTSQRSGNSTDIRTQRGRRTVTNQCAKSWWLASLWNSLKRRCETLARSWQDVRAEIGWSRGWLSCGMGCGIGWRDSGGGELSKMSDVWHRSHLDFFLFILILRKKLPAWKQTAKSINWKRNIRF